MNNEQNIVAYLLNGITVRDSQCIDSLEQLIRFATMGHGVYHATVLYKEDKYLKIKFWTHDSEMKCGYYCNEAVYTSDEISLLHVATVLAMLFQHENPETSFPMLALNKTAYIKKDFLKIRDYSTSTSPMYLFEHEKNSHTEMTAFSC